jgi:hypothetical protein
MFSSSPLALLLPLLSCDKDSPKGLCKLQSLSISRSAGEPLLFFERACFLHSSNSALLSFFALSGFDDDVDGDKPKLIGK